jgi:hypothetical protein
MKLTKGLAATWLIAALWGLIPIHPVYSQGTSLGVILGRVTDSQGAVIANATVEITDLFTEVVRRAVSDGTGNFEAAGLVYGEYKVIVSAEGFSPMVFSEISLNTASVVRVDARLNPRAPRENVAVTVNAAQLDAGSSVLSQSLDARSLLALPRDSRDVYSFLYLNPNITQGATSGAFKYAGAQTYGASYSLDAQRSNGGIFGEPTASQPSLEAVGEIRVVSNTFDAQYAGVSNIRVETRRGTRNFHGSLFHNNKNSALAAWDYSDKIAQANDRPNFNLNEVGGSFGGPLPAARSFFMIAYERQFLNTPVHYNSARLPGARLWDGDFSQLTDTAKPAVPNGVSLTPSEVAGDTVGGLGSRFIRIPPRLLNPVTGQLIHRYFPAVNVSEPVDPSTGTLLDYFGSAPGVSRRDLGTVRVDSQSHERKELHVAYNVSALSASNNPVVNPFTGLGLTQNHRQNQTVSGSYVQVFAGNAINEVRGGINAQNFFRRSNQLLRDFLVGIGFDASDIAAYGNTVGPSALNTFGHTAIMWGSGFANFGNGGRNTYRPQDQSLVTFGDTFTLTKGRHTLKGGADLVRNAATDGFANNRGNPRGLIVYGGSGPDAFARFLMGLPADRVSYVDRLRPPMEVFDWENGFFLQDDFKANARLTLNVGLRYEISTPFTEKNDVLANFDPGYVSPSGRKGRFVLPSKRTLDFIDPRIVSFGYVFAPDIGLPRSLVHTDLTRFGPRLGLALRLTGEMNVRAGFGRYFPTSAAQGMRDAMASNPFNQTRTKTAATSALSVWPGFIHGVSPLSGGTLNTIGQTPAVGAIPFRLKDPKIDQFSATFEASVGRGVAARVSYLGSRLHDLITGRDLNMIAPSDIPFGTTIGDGITACDPDEGDCDYSPADLARQPFAGLGDSMASYGNFGHGRSDALQFEVSRRNAAGIIFAASYTVRSQKSTAVDSANSTLGGTAYNQFRPEYDYARDSFISRHRFVGYGLYEFPSHVSLLRKWEVAWQAFAKSGVGFTPYWICNNCGPAAPGNIGSTYLDAVGDFNANSYRPLVIGDISNRAGDRIWDPEAFT